MYQLGNVVKIKTGEHAGRLGTVVQIDKKSTFVDRQNEHLVMTAKEPIDYSVPIVTYKYGVDGDGWNRRCSDEDLEFVERGFTVGDTVRCLKSTADGQFAKGHIYKVTRVMHRRINCIDSTGQPNGWKNHFFELCNETLEGELTPPQEENKTPPLSPANKDMLGEILIDLHYHGSTTRKMLSEAVRKELIKDYLVEVVTERIECPMVGRELYNVFKISVRD